MKGVNKVILIGNVGRVPDIQYIEGNIPVAKFPLATTETYRDRNGAQASQTEWHTVVVWRGLAELAQKYLHKGSLVFVEGKLRTEIVADNLVMLDKRKDSEQEQSGEGPQESFAAPEMPVTNNNDDKTNLSY
jgi:single-strand DNA-binding protein